MQVPQLVVVAWLALGSLGLATDWFQSTTFRLLGGNEIVVSASIGGAGPFRFLVDTGSSRTAVAAEVVTTLRLGSVGRTTVLTPSGRALRTLVNIGGLSIGPGVSGTVLAMVVPRSQLTRSVTVDGIIGQDILARFIYTIDYERREIEWHARPPEAGGERVTLESSDGRLIVRLPQDRVPRRSLSMVPDSAADRLLLFERAGASLPRVTPLDAGGLQTLSGSRIVRRVVIDRLDVGQIRLTDQEGVIVRDAGEGAPFGDGLLPLHLFSRVTINVRDSYMVVVGTKNKERKTKNGTAEQRTTEPNKEP